jgi:bifunctional DNase/RNase
MTTVRIARAEHIPQSGRRSRGRLPGRAPTHLVVLADDAGRRELRLWMQPVDGRSLEGLLERAAGTRPQAPGEAGGTACPLADTADELTCQLLDAVGASVAAVDISELGPEVTAARIELGGPAGTRHVTARLSEGLALAITTGAPVRVADAVMDRLAVPSGEAEQPGSAQGPDRGPGAATRPVGTTRPRYEPRNMAFTDGLDGWHFFGSFAEHAVQSHWHDYAVEADHGIAVLRSTVPQPEGFAILAQAVFADDYHSATVTFRGEFRVSAGRGRAGLGLRVNEGHPIRGPLTEESVLADPDNNIVTIHGGRDWTRHEVTARVPEDSEVIAFAIFLAGPGQIELRSPELVRA